MFFKRCAFIIIYISLSDLNSSSGKAAASNLLDITARRDETILTHNVVERKNHSFSKSENNLPIDRELRRSNPNRSPEPSQKNSLELNSADSESFPAINRFWVLGAMTLTASVSLFLLWVLFRKPTQNLQAATEVGVTERQLEISQTDLVSPSKSPSKPKTATPDSNLTEQKAIASSVLEIDSDDSLVDTNAVQIDVVRELIQDLQLGDSGKKISVESDPTAQISRRRKAIWELTKVGDYRSIEPLLKIMPQVGEPDRSLILDAVTRITHRSFQPIDEQLFAKLQDRDPEVRLNAVRDLKNLYQFVAPVITKISQMQSDADYEVRKTAVQALAELNANPLPTFTNSAEKSVEREVNKLVSGEDSKANLHLVAYLLEELDAEK